MFCAAARPWDALNERHLKRLLSAYVSYHEDRTYHGLGKGTLGCRTRFRTSGRVLSHDRLGRILTARSGRIEPLIPRAPLASSGGKWKAITLEKHLADPDYVRTDFAVYSNLVHIFTGRPLTQEWRIDGRSYRVQNTAGSLMVAPKGIQASVSYRPRSIREKQFFREKLDHLFHIEIFYAIVIEGTRSKTGVTAAISRLAHDPKGGLQELKTQFSNDKLKVLLREQIEGDLIKLEQRVHSFVRQLSDLVQIDILSQNECFRFLRCLLNYDDWRIDGHPNGTQFLDCQVANSDIEAERDHLRVGDHYVRVLTIKEAISETKPLVLKQLLEVQV
jgi:hypothetical protein